MKYFTLLLLLLSGCNENPNTYVKYKLFEFDVDNIIVSSEDAYCQISKSATDTELVYCVESRCVSYWLKDASGVYLSEAGDTLDLLFATENEYRINNSVYAVKKFLTNRNAIDSESQHYWSPDFGVILVKSSTWGSFKIMTLPCRGDKDALHALTTVLLRDVVAENKNDQDLDIIDSVTNKMIEDELK